MAWRTFTKSKLYDFKNRYELIPIIASVGAVCVAAAATMGYSLFKLDVQVNHKKPPRHESMDLMHPTSKKFITINQKYEPMPELHQLLSEIKEEEQKQQASH